jgi:hypothetical protein
MVLSSGSASGTGSCTAGSFVTATNSDSGPTCTPNNYYARVYNSAAISTTNTVEVALTFDSERNDVGAFHSTGSQTERLVIPADGFYGVFGSVIFAGDPDGRRNLFLRVDGTTYIAKQTMITDPGGGAIELAIATGYHFTAGQYVELMVSQNSGGNLDVNSTGNSTPEFGAYFIAP